MSPADAAKYPVDSTVTLHYRKAKMVAWGELVAVTHGKAAHSEHEAA
jgi:hypothetical protein